MQRNHIKKYLMRHRAS